MSGEITSPTCHTVALDQGGISDAIGLHITLPIAKQDVLKSAGGSTNLTWIDLEY